MLVKVSDFTGRQKAEVEIADTDEFVKHLGAELSKRWGYHGNFTIQLPSGEKAYGRLKDNEEFMGLDLDETTFPVIQA